MLLKMSSIQHQECKVFNWIETNECLCLFCCIYFIFILPDQNNFFCKCITPPTLHDAGCSLASDNSHQNLDQASAQSWPLIIWSQVIDCLQRKHFSSHTAQMFHNFHSHKIWYIWRQDRYLDWFSSSVQKAYQCTSRVRNMVWDTKLLLTA